MSATEDMIAELREYIAEPTADTWADPNLATVIEKYPLIDSDGNEPDESDWTATYDLNAAAANMWRRKAAALAALYDFSADGGKFSRSQLQEQALKMARFYGSRRMPASITTQKPRTFERDYQSTDDAPPSYIVNLLPKDEGE